MAYVSKSIRYHIVVGSQGGKINRLEGSCDSHAELQDVMRDQYSIAQNAKAHGVIKGKVIATRVEVI